MTYREIVAEILAAAANGSLKRIERSIVLDKLLAPVGADMIFFLGIALRLRYR